MAGGDRGILILGSTRVIWSFDLIIGLGACGTEATYQSTEERKPDA